MILHTKIAYDVKEKEREKERVRDRGREKERALREI